MAATLEDQIAEAEAPDDGDEGDEGGDVAPPEPLDDDDEGEAAEPDEPAEETEPPSPSAEKVVRELEGEHTRHRKALVRIMGDSFTGYDDCPLCFAMGYIPGSPLKQDAKTKTCEYCDGAGQVRTGASPLAQFQRQCPECIGNGYVPVEDATAPAFTFDVNNTNTPTQTAYVPPVVKAAREAGYIVLDPVASTPLA